MDMVIFFGWVVEKVGEKVYGYGYVLYPYAQKIFCSFELGLDAQKSVKLARWSVKVGKGFQD
jgi:hypothetical protein